jgi:hypothetical protein
VKIWVREIEAYQRELVMELISPSFALSEQSNKRKVEIDSPKEKGKKSTSKKSRSF